MQKPKMEDYGYIDPSMGMDGEGGWTIEGGEDAYLDAVAQYEYSVGHVTEATPVKLKPKDLYKSMTATELLREIEVLTELQKLCISVSRLDKFGILIRCALTELNLRGDAILEQVQFDYQDGTEIC